MYKVNGIACMSVQRLLLQICNVVDSNLEFRRKTQPHSYNYARNFAPPENFPLDLVQIL